MLKNFNIFNIAASTASTGAVVSWPDGEVPGGNTGIFSYDQDIDIIGYRMSSAFYIPATTTGTFGAFLMIGQKLPLITVATGFSNVIDTHLFQQESVTLPAITKEFTTGMMFTHCGVIRLNANRPVTLYLSVPGAAPTLQASAAVTLFTLPVV